MKSFPQRAAQFCSVAIVLLCLLALDLHPVIGAEAGSDQLALDVQPSIVPNGSFEEPIVRSAGYDVYRAGQTFGGWTVESGSVDHISKNLWQASEGLQSVDMNGSPGIGIIYQDVPTIPQQTYQLSFDLSGNPGGPPVIKQMAVWWGTTLVDTLSFDTTGNSNWNMGWESHAYLVTATTEITRLRFESLIPDRYGPALDNVAVRIASQTDVFIAGTKEGSYHILPHSSMRVSYPAINSGPVKIIDTTNDPLIAAQRVIYTVDGVHTSFSEVMAMPDSQLDTTYWLPWYNNRDLSTQLRFGNVSDTPATVHVFIGGVEVADSPYELGVGESTRVAYAGVNDGPVKMESDVPIVAAERIIFTANGVRTSYTEIMGLPNGALDTSYWLPWYNNVDLDTQLRFGNVSNTPASVHVFIGGAEVADSPYVLAVGESTRVAYRGVNSGPVKIESNVPIVAAERVIHTVNSVRISFTEMMALPHSQLDTTYWLPWYNNIDLDSQLRLGNVSDTPATVHVFIGGAEVTGSPYTLQVGESKRVAYAGVNDGSVQIVSDVPVVAAERVIYTVNGVRTSFSESMALPDSLLATTYWLPWYNNIDLDSQLRFGRP